MKIELRDKRTGTVLGEIDRKPFTRGMCGNFLPHWIRYKRKEFLLQGGWDYAYLHGKPDEAYIEITDNNGKVLAI